MLRRTPRDLYAAADGVLGRSLEGPPDGAPLDLPLFDADRAPLRPPQRPLGVRRAGHVTPRRPLAARPSVGVLPLEPEAPPQDREAAPGGADALPSTPQNPAGLWRRVGAWFVDVCAIALVDVLTLYFTLRVAGLEPAAWGVLPRFPLAMFFAVLNGGYVILLTATLGQTLGKMALDVEVVADGQPSVGVARATVRTLAACVSLAPAGLGLLWAFWGDHRPLHDRVSGTRVVQSAA